jgi:uncharacterized protein DUF4328
MEGESIRPAGSRARFAIAAIYASSIGTALLLGIEMFEVAVGVPVDRLADDDPRLIVVGLAACCVVPVWVITIPAGIVGFLLWLHRAYSNARVLVQDLAYSPGYAVGCWFIPIVQLYEPYRVMRSLEGASFPDDDNPWALRMGSGEMTAWWALFLLRGVVETIAFRAHEATFGPVSVVLHLLAAAITIAAAVLAHRTIARIQRMQDAKVQIATFA